jgi:hypothetical protein
MPDSEATAFSVFLREIFWLVSIQTGVLKKKDYYCEGKLSVGV